MDISIEIIQDKKILEILKEYILKQNTLHCQILTEVAG